MGAKVVSHDRYVIFPLVEGAAQAVRGDPEPDQSTGGHSPERAKMDAGVGDRGCQGQRSQTLKERRWPDGTLGGAVKAGWNVKENKKV